MHEINFQGIFDMLHEILPSSWDEMIFYAAYTPGSYNMKYYTKCGAEIIDCYNQADVNRMQIMKTFMLIDKELSAARKSLAPADVWSVMTMIVDRDGNMKTHFDYSDISENVIEYTRRWEQQYL